MTSEQQRLVLTRGQAACLDALRRRSLAKSEIAIEAKLSLNTTAKELDQLADLGLAKKKPGSQVEHYGTRQDVSFRECADTATPRQRYSWPGREASA